MYVYMFDYCSVPTTPCRLSTLPTYYIPKDGPLQTYKEYINQLPNVDDPEAFGQHPNADIASQIKETRSVSRCRVMVGAFLFMQWAYWDMSAN